MIRVPAMDRRVYHGRARAFWPGPCGWELPLGSPRDETECGRHRLQRVLRFDSDEHRIGHTFREHPCRARSKPNHAEKLSPMS